MARKHGPDLLTATKRHNYTLRMHGSYKMNRTILDKIERSEGLCDHSELFSNLKWQSSKFHHICWPGQVPKLIKAVCNSFFWFSGRYSLWSGKWPQSLRGPYTLTWWDIAETTYSSSSEIMGCNWEHTHEKRHVFYDDVNWTGYSEHIDRHHCRFKDDSTQDRDLHCEMCISTTVVLKLGKLETTVYLCDSHLLTG